MNAKDLTGLRFGRLVVESRDKNAELKSHTPMWSCVCDCGKRVIVRGKSLTGGVTRSCGCYAKECLSKRVSKHYGFGSRLYNIWNSMRQRCNNVNNKAYKNYGARGISICREWDDFSTFREWAYENGYKDDAPRGDLTIDRIDVNGNYEPSNCRWISMKIQSNNKRSTQYYCYNGQTRSLSEWADITGIKYNTLWRRYKAGWNPERALNT